MKTRVLLGLLVIGFSLSSCKNPDMATDSPETGQCTIHRRPLLHVAGYTAEPTMLIDGTRWRERLDRRYPYGLGLRQSLVPTRLCPMPAEVSYCPECEERIQASIDRHAGE